MKYISNNYNKAKKIFYKTSPGAYKTADKNKMVIKYLTSGGTAAATDLILLFLLTDILNLWYIISASLSFIVAFFISFFLQKFWTFRDRTRDKIKQQMGLYFFIGVVNLIINGLGMYVLVDFFNIMYIFAQVIAGAFIAVVSFLIYRYVIFKKGKNKYYYENEDQSV